MTTHVRIALSEKDFDRLLEIVAASRFSEDPIVYKLRAKKLAYQGQQIAKGHLPVKKTAKKAS